jgi:hypothetical protein
MMMRSFSNTIKYQFISREYSDKHVAQEAIKTLLVKATPTSSCWWSKLKRRVGDAKTNIDAIRIAQEVSLKDEENLPEGGMTTKTCSGILNLFNKTYLVKAPADIVITIDSDENYRWNTAADELVTIAVHNKKQFWSEGNDLFANKVCFKIILKIRLSTNGFGYMLTEPYYHNTLGLSFALGYVSDVYAQSEELNIFMFLDVPKEGTKTVTIPKGTTLQYLIPDVKSRLVFGKKRFVADLLDTEYGNKRHGK